MEAQVFLNTGLVDPRHDLVSGGILQRHSRVSEVAFGSVYRAGRRGPAAGAARATFSPPRGQGQPSVDLSIAIGVIGRERRVALLTKSETLIPRRSGVSGHGGSPLA